ncbi:MAG: hypothetical protein WC554_10575 [Clostridia bacterium]
MIKTIYKKRFSEGLREVEVIFDDGSIIKTSMATNLSDEEILDYYKVGKKFNIGSIDDKMVKVKKVNIKK